MQENENVNHKNSGATNWEPYSPEFNFTIGAVAESVWNPSPMASCISAIAEESPVFDVVIPVRSCKLLQRFITAKLSRN